MEFLSFVLEMIGALLFAAILPGLFTAWALCRWKGIDKFGPIRFGLYPQCQSAYGKVALGSSFASFGMIPVFWLVFYVEPRGASVVEYGGVSLCAVTLLAAIASKKGIRGVMCASALSMSIWAWGIAELSCSTIHAYGVVRDVPIAD